MSPAPWASLVAAGFCGAASMGFGRWLVARLNCGPQPWPIHFLLGSVVLASGVFALAASGALVTGLLLALGAWGCVSGWRTADRPVNQAGWMWWLALCPFAIIYMVWALAPEHSPDGLAYHWNLPLRYLRAGGLFFEPASIYAQFPQAMEMLYAFGLAFGPRAPALIHLLFLAALTALMVEYASPRGGGMGAVTAAGLFFCSPVTGIDAASAYNDVALAAACFGVFFLSRGDTRQPGVLMAAGLLAGFAMSLKYTGALAILYLVGVLIAGRVPPATCAWVGLAVGIPAAPWLLKNAWMAGNPVSPFLNSWFPNPVFDHVLEQAYLANLRWPATGIEWTRIPWEVCVAGEKLRGLLGPAFLAMPAALFVLRRPEALSLLCPAVLFALPFAANAGTRFLLPALPFWALLLARSLPRAPVAGALLLGIQAISCWPAVLDLYTPPYAWRIRGFPWEAALGREPEGDFLARRLAEIRLLPALEQATGTVLALGPYPEAYSKAHFWIANQSRVGTDAARVIWSVVFPGQRPTTRLRFWFPRRQTSGVRLVQTQGPPISIAELRFYDLLEPVRRKPSGLRARPNRYQAHQALDGALFTRWTSWHRSGLPTYFELHFDERFGLSRVEMDIDGIDPLPGLAVEVEARGAWVRASERFELTAGAEEGFDPMNEALRGLWVMGVREVLIQDSDYRRLDVSAFDTPAERSDFSYARLAQVPGARLYRITKR